MYAATLMIWSGSYIRFKYSWRVLHSSHSQWKVFVAKNKTHRWMLRINKFFICTLLFIWICLMEVIFIENYSNWFTFWLHINFRIYYVRQTRPKQWLKRDTLAEKRFTKQRKDDYIYHDDEKKNQNLIWQQFPAVLVHGKIYLLKMLFC